MTVEPADMAAPEVVHIGKFDIMLMSDLLKSERIGSKYDAIVEEKWDFEAKKSCFETGVKVVIYGGAPGDAQGAWCYPFSKWKKDLP
ncbi:hypothetical protein E3N88_37332 [Mikania micrantha]|uniref:Uncharacterized protein n=1 Tax=Mikania micrantha TaxID=192012 RepID=A0A5N6LRS2_9ASTR|nr:hypothetical protein E3N88_37332 [Mikania micrantha]